MRFRLTALHSVFSSPRPLRRDRSLPHAHLAGAECGARGRGAKLLLGLAAWALAGAVQAFGFDDLARRAERLARQPHRPTAAALPLELKELSYDQYRDIRFRPERALWRREGLPFELMFFHLGKFATDPVRINEITPQGEVRHIAFDRADFDYGRNRLDPQSWGDLGFAGFRVHYPVNTPEYKDEVVVFLGASYFRAVGREQRYGLSARGLAIDTVGGQGEEFPRFTEFWIERPASGADSLSFLALLESPRATGAYRFVLRPGKPTELEVQSRVFLRGPVATLGIAPLTSMFMYGENQPLAGHFRPEVHDSDGLSIASADGEWLWRPLLNPSRTQVNSFAMRGIRGFGLMQRDRAFPSYEDVEARYELRPSAWVEPLNDWGPGRVELVQLPTPDETNDNIVAYWVPERLPAPGRPLEMNYRLRWQGREDQRPPNGWTVQTRTGRGFEEPAPGEHQYIVDFAGPALDALPGDAGVEPVVSVGPNARLLERNAYRNDAAGGWRMTLRVQRLDASQPVELRAFLQRGADALTETWTSLIPPN
ncbi:glucan biosynthesis protein G [Caldimonas tepidiphila]|uniref:glucan biosynthesis protein G n=1 Tax=Caldimonas tepidiphila TaxID=2315841 RepID=UPI000E5BA154